mmetsp:Transcript_3008/g.6975  ORF Transcript_3008/g.6975 Transcript_3008/m.6975 type:complete len:147 (+) Transcript_3008:2-442(+)
MGKNRAGKLCYYPEASRGRGSSTSSSGSTSRRQEDDGFGHLRGSRNDYQYEQRRVAAGCGAPSMQVNAKPNNRGGLKLGRHNVINPARLEKGGKGQAAVAWTNGASRGSNGTSRAWRGADAEALSSEVAGKGPSKFAPPGRTRNKR